jgi:uncharacterized membrane-anchored protein
MQHLARKVPQITVLFWLVKVITTALGESTSDYLVYAINPYIAVGLGALGLLVGLALQFSARKYNAWTYWFTVTMVAIFGTMAADVIHIVLGVPYSDSTVFFAIALSIVFALWYGVEKTLSIHSITSPRRELFYWLTVMSTFALGTAAGDMTAFTLNLGFLDSAFLFAGVIAVIAILHYATSGWLLERHTHQSSSAVLGFWLAYIFTRPLGASLADWFGKGYSGGGLGWGDGTVSAILVVLLVGIVWYLAATRIDVDRSHTT